MAKIPGDFAPRACVLTPREVRLAWRSEGRGSVLLLGDDALLLLNPRDVAVHLPAPPCTVLLAPRFSSYDTLFRWNDEAGLRPVDPGRLQQTVEAALASPLRRPLDRRAWAPRAKRHDPLVSRILAAIPDLQDLSPSGLSRYLRMKAGRLRRACVRLFGMSPLALLWEYRCAYALFRIAQGTRYSVVAFEVGYSDEPNLRKAFRKRGIPLPARRRIPRGRRSKRTGR